ncbi:hypothetical protein L218DRAFT_131278 [Marasmius fiardii PR-910]|nr:hypothetical protein L218DRAFT_131278 [Marasmius fiardii PR-910]
MNMPERAQDLRYQQLRRQLALPVIWSPRALFSYPVCLVLVNAWLKTNIFRLGCLNGNSIPMDKDSKCRVYPEFWRLQTPNVTTELERDVTLLSNHTAEIFTRRRELIYAQNGRITSRLCHCTCFGLQQLEPLYNFGKRSVAYRRPSSTIGGLLLRAR